MPGCGGGDNGLIGAVTDIDGAASTEARRFENVEVLCGLQYETGNIEMN